jgi:trehalose 6-phosphate synthase
MIQLFVHVPWPTPQYWKVLPKEMRDAILEGILGCDIVAFQSSLDVRNFLMTCEENGGLKVDERERAVVSSGRVVYARHYPISVDIPRTIRLAASRGVKRQEEELASWRPRHLIARIDRTDPSKNIVRGFIAYEKLLRYHPDLRGQVQFWAFLQPSRQDVGLYSRYLRQIRQTAGRINSEFGTDNWLPIRLEIAESERKAIAALKNFDVLLVNPVYDGLNLVVKEGALVNQTDGVIVLSENAGAHEELRGSVLSINPFDVVATADAMYAALTMASEDRHRMNDAAREVVRTNDIARWISNQMQDLRDLIAPGNTPRHLELHVPGAEPRERRAGGEDRRRPGR